MVDEAAITETTGGLRLEIAKGSESIYVAQIVFDETTGFSALMKTFERNLNEPVHNVILRAPNGQTGLLREGEELGGVKLLRIGTNRVLVEHEQQQKELTVFSGFGSETLLPKGKANRQ